MRRNSIAQNVWHVDMSNKESITKEDAKFIFEQAEKFLKSTTDVGVSIVTRTNTLITLSIGLIVGLFGYSINQFEKTGYLNERGVSCIVGIIYLMAVVLYTIKNIQPNLYFISGSQPNKLLVDAFFAENIEAEKRIIRFYISEIHAYQKRIQENEKINTKRWLRYRITIWALLFVPILLSISYLVSNVIL